MNSLFQIRWSFFRAPPWTVSIDLRYAKTLMRFAARDDEMSTSTRLSCTFFGQPHSLFTPQSSSRTFSLFCTKKEFLISVFPVHPALPLSATYAQKFSAPFGDESEKSLSTM